MNRIFLAATAGLILLSCSAHAEEDDLGQDTFNERCASCHGRDGKARTDIGRKLKTKDLTDAQLWKDLTDERIRAQIIEGTPDGAMPPYKGKLSAEELAALVRYLRQTFQPK